MLYQIAAQYVVVAFALASVGYGTITDLRSRTVNALLFVPLVVAGIASNLLLEVPLFFVVSGVAIFLLTFLKTDTYAYLGAAAFFLVLAVYLLMAYSVYYGFQMLIMALVYAMGFGESLFGIGDIKAIIALMFSIPDYVNLGFFPLFTKLSLVSTALPILLYITIFSTFLAFYAIGVTRRSGKADHSHGIFTLAYDEDILKAHPVSFGMKEKNGEKYLYYRVPFMLPIALGLVLFLIAGAIP